MMNFGERKARVVFDMLDKMRIDHEAVEDFEACAFLRDTMADLEEFILGYRELDERVMSIMYESCKAFGEYIKTSVYQSENAMDGEYEYETMWILEGHTFYFQVNAEEALKIEENYNGKGYKND
jgi:hypothetical protein